MKYKLWKQATSEWQAVLRERRHREAFRAMEQAIAADAWKVRKDELGIADAQDLDREMFVAQITRQTRDQAWHPPQKRTLEQLREDEARLAQEMEELHTLLQTTEHAMAYAQRLAQRTPQQSTASQHRERGPKVQHGYDPSGRIFDRSRGR